MLTPYDIERLAREHCQMRMKEATEERMARSMKLSRRAWSGESRIALGSQGDGRHSMKEQCVVVEGGVHGR